MFLVGRKPKTKVFTKFFASGCKSHDIYKVVRPAPSTNTGIYAGFTTMLQDVASISEKDKNTANYSVWVCS